MKKEPPALKPKPKGKVPPIVPKKLNLKLNSTSPENKINGGDIFQNKTTEGTSVPGKSTSNIQNTKKDDLAIGLKNARSKPPITTPKPKKIENFQSPEAEVKPLGLKERLALYESNNKSNESLGLKEFSREIYKDIKTSEPKKEQVVGIRNNRTKVIPAKPDHLKGHQKAKSVDLKEKKVTFYFQNNLSLFKY